MACSIEIGGINGESLDGSGLPTRLSVYVRRQGDCSQVEITVRLTANGPPLFVALATPDSNGTAGAEFHVEPPVFACGFPLWVEARCTTGSVCSAAAQSWIDCKDVPDSGPGNGPGNGPGGGGGGNNDNDDDWPWGLPPQLFCPLIGRAFTLALLTGLVMLLTGIAMSQPVVSATAVAIIAGAFSVLAVWRHWCQIPYCYFWGAILWVLKRCLAAGLVLTLVFISVPCLLATLGIGVISGIITNRLRHAHCRLPHITTPLNQLPLW